MLVTERAGRLRVIDKDFKLMPALVEGVPAVQAIGQGGLMDVALHPKFADNKLVYLSYSAGDRNGIGHHPAETEGSKREGESAQRVKRGAGLRLTLFAVCEHGIENHR